MDELDDTSPFQIGEEVLVAKGEHFFLGTLSKINSTEKLCLIKFDDGTEHWSKFKDVNSTSPPEDEVMCVHCKSSKAVSENSVIVCKTCSRGYHQLCHKPNIKKVHPEWRCKRCCQSTSSSPTKSTPTKHKTKPANTKTKTESKGNDVEERHLPALPVSRKELPYDPSALVWYMQHRFNTQKMYCYCGNAGDWYLKMIQCNRCLQWYHEKCVRALTYPLYLGDRFFIFVCAVCNKGTEYLRRVELVLKDLVHLILFNLTAYKGKNRFSEYDIVRYANLHWPFLQLPPKILKVADANRKELILETLRNCSRFKFVTKSGTSGWGLKLRVPPDVPSFTVPSSHLNDQSLRQIFDSSEDLKLIKFFTPPPLNPKFHCPEEINYIPNNGLHNLHVDRGALSLPRSVSGTVHNVCIKSASPCIPAPKSVVERKIRKQQQERSSSSRPSSTQVCEPIKIKVNKHMIAESCQALVEVTPPDSAPNTPNPDNQGETSSSEKATEESSHQISVPPTPATSSGDEISETGPRESRNNKSVLQLLGHQKDVKPAITLPMPLNPVITNPFVKPVKRRLSEKDIRINRNGEVKRRRVRRQCTIQKPYYDPEENPFSQPTQSINYVSHTPAPSYSLPDLKAAVIDYFSPKNRILRGEPYEIKGKKVTPDGKEEYLIVFGEHKCKYCKGSMCTGSGP